MCAMQKNLYKTIRNLTNLLFILCTRTFIRKQTVFSKHFRNNAYNYCAYKNAQTYFNLSFSKLVNDFHKKGFTILTEFHV